MRGGGAMNISSNNLRGFSQYSLLNKQEMANCRKGIWRSAFMLNSVLTKQETASLGYIYMNDSLDTYIIEPRSQLNTTSTKPPLHGNIHNHAAAVFLFPFFPLADIAFEEF